jgi:hypothetical protein
MVSNKFYKAKFLIELGCYINAHKNKYNRNEAKLSPTHALSKTSLRNQQTHLELL